MSLDLNKAIFNGLAISFVFRLFQSFGGLAINGILARNLTTEEYGNYFVLLSLASILSIFFLFGRNTLLMKGIASGQSNCNSLLYRNSFIVSLQITIVAIIFFSDTGRVFLSLTGLILPHYLLYPVFIFSIVITYQSLLYEYYRGLSKISKSVLIANYGALGSIGYGAVSTILIIVYILFNIDRNIELDNLLWAATFLGLLVILFFYLIIIKSKTKILKTNNNQPSSSIFLFLASIVAIVMTQVDLLIVAKEIGGKDVSLYGVAQRLSLFSLMPLMIVTVFYQPISARLFNTGNRVLLSTLSRIVNSVLIYISLMTIVFFLIFGSEVIEIVFGHGFNDSYNILIIKTLGMVGLILGGLSNAIFTTVNHEKAYTLIGIFSIAIYLIAISVIDVLSLSTIAILHSSMLVLMSIICISYSKIFIGLDISPIFNPDKLLKEIKKYKSNYAHNL